MTETYVDAEPAPKIPASEDDVVDMNAMRMMTETGSRRNSGLVDALRGERARRDKLAARRASRRGRNAVDGP